MSSTSSSPPAVARLAARQVALGYGSDPVIGNLTLAVPPGRITAIVGANGCGKSTLLRGLGRLLRPQGGQVLLDGRDIHRMPTKEVARVLGLLPQSPIAPEGITVTELVGLGRHPHTGLFRQWGRSDDEAVAQALDVTDTAELAGRPVEELSGGQRQRVWIAMVLAQQTDLLLLDEPTSFLDIAHAVEVLDLVTDLNRTAGTTVVMVLHDLNLAARYADHLVAMSRGGGLVEGAPADVLTAQVVKEHFGVACHLLTDPVSGTPLVVPIGRHHAELRPVPTGGEWR